MKKLTDYKKIEVTNHTQTKIRVTVCEENGILYVWISPKEGPSVFELKEEETKNGIFKSDR